MMATFELLQPVRNPMAGERNPHRDGWYLRTIHRRGRLNPGHWAVVLHTDGEETETPLDKLIPLPSGFLAAQALTRALREQALEAVAEAALVFEQVYGAARLATNFPVFAAALAHLAALGGE